MGAVKHAMQEVEQLLIDDSVMPPIRAHMLVWGCDDDGNDVGEEFVLRSHERERMVMLLAKVGKVPALTTTEHIVAAIKGAKYLEGAMSTRAQRLKLADLLIDQSNELAAAMKSIASRLRR